MMFVAGPLSEEDFFQWEALVVGPEGTPYVSATCYNSMIPIQSSDDPLQEGGVFCAKLVFVRTSSTSFLC
jgi:hypothetical protein